MFKSILKSIANFFGQFFLYEHKQRLDYWADTNTAEPLFKLKEENESRFSEKVTDVDSENQT